MRRTDKIRAHVRALREWIEREGIGDPSRSRSGTLRDLQGIEKQVDALEGELDAVREPFPLLDGVPPCRILRPPSPVKLAVIHESAPERPEASGGPPGRKHKPSTREAVNHFGVVRVASGKGVHLTMPPRVGQRLSTREALELAAWLLMTAVGGDLEQPVGPDGDRLSLLELLDRAGYSWEP